MGGSHGFRLSDIMPNAWFYKLTNKNKNKNRSKANSAANTALLPNRPSLYSSGRAQAERPSPSPAPPLPPSQAASVELAAGFNLPPIATKPAPAAAARESSRRPLSPGLRRLRTRASSPRLAGRRAPAGPRGGRRAAPVAARSVAVVKASADPHRDFRESMVEMIVENGIRAPRDLEELLACYLSLNSDEYHGVIVKAFEQIWFDLGGVDPCDQARVHRSLHHHHHGIDLQDVD